MIRLGLTLVAALCLSGCTGEPCEETKDCPVGQVCGKGRLCVARQCGLTLDSGTITSNCEPGYRCSEGMCQLSGTDYLDPDAGTTPDAG